MRTKKGIVVSAKNDKTAVVLVHISKMHPILRKAYRVSKKFHAHDKDNKCKIGDEVLISEIRPISKMKCWNVEKITKESVVISDAKDEDVIESLLKSKKQDKEEAEEIQNNESISKKDESSGSDNKEDQNDLIDKK